MKITVILMLFVSIHLEATTVIVIEDLLVMAHFALVSEYEH